MAYVIRRPMSQLLQRQVLNGYYTWTSQACKFSESCLGKRTASSDLVQLRRFSAEVSASDQMNLIRQLRERTCAPIKDVKSALVGCNWDIDEAQKDLRKRGVVMAAKKSARAAAEGLLAVAQDGKRAVVIELNCETDFVARNEIFQYLVRFTSEGLFLVHPFGPRMDDGDQVYALVLTSAYTQEICEASLGSSLVSLT